MDAASPKQAIPAFAGYFTSQDLINSAEPLHKSISNLTPDYFEFGQTVTLSDGHQSPPNIKIISFSDDLESPRASEQVKAANIFTQSAKPANEFAIYEEKAQSLNQSDCGKATKGYNN